MDTNVPTKTGAYIVASDSLVLVIDGVNYTISKTSSLYPRVKDAVIHQDWTKAQGFCEQATALKGEIWYNAEEGLVFYGTEPLNHALAGRIPRMLEEGFDTKPLVTFLKNLFQNPAPHAIQELYEFLEKNSLPITEDGCFLAYKKVREDYTDVFSGAVDNHIGQKPSMDRDLCDPVRTNHCSTGYHFCGLSYLTCFGGERVMVVKINPKDVTSIPNDYDFAKGRCCTYEVVDEYGGTDVMRYEAFPTSIAPSDLGEEEYEEETCSECGAYLDECECEDEDEEWDDSSQCPDDYEHNLFSQPVTPADTTNPIKQARLQRGLTPAQVADGLGVSVKTYLTRIEVEGRFFKPSTVGRVVHIIEMLAKEK